MDRVFSAEEVADFFWAASPAPSGGASMNRSPSEWFFEKFLEEAAASSAHSTNPILKHTVASNQDAPLSVVGSNFCGAQRDVGRVGDDEVVQIKAPAGHSDRPAPVDPGNYQALLKQNLDMICAAVAMSRVNPVSQLS